MRNYLELLRHVLAHGVEKQDRTGVGTLSVFGSQLRFDLNAGFPLVTTKRIHLRSVIHELLWFLSGDSNIRYLHDNRVTIWDEWADANGDLGPIYGQQWRRWPTPSGEAVDQLARLVEGLRRDPDSRRHLVSAWNVADLPRMGLPPCHYSFQCYVVDGRLSCLFNMRSVDCFLGLPFNIASYALLTHMLAQQCDYGVGELIFCGADTHVYLNHLEQVRLQLSREPYPPPTLVLHRRPASLFEYRYEDIEIRDYRHHPAIPAPVAV
jgi:thymidylate synthase